MLVLVSLINLSNSCCEIGCFYCVNHDKWTKYKCGYYDECYKRCIYGMGNCKNDRWWLHHPDLERNQCCGVCQLKNSNNQKMHESNFLI